MIKKEKIQLKIFFIVTFGVCYLMGILMAYGYFQKINIGVFPLAQMMYPAAAVVLAKFVTEKDNLMLPKTFFKIILGITGVLIGIAIVSVVFPTQGEVWETASNAVCMAMTLLLFFPSLFFEDVKKRKAFGLKYLKIKQSVLCIAVYIILYSFRLVFLFILEVRNGVEILKIHFEKSEIWLGLISLPLNFLLTASVFFGEEYGWRYYLQPILQRRFGLRRGVIFLGIIWGMWHLPLNLFYYNSLDGAMQSIITQVGTCIGMGIFFGWAYMKTNNIWVPVILHFLHNSRLGIFGFEELQKVSVVAKNSWTDAWISVLTTFLCFGFFLFGKEFLHKKEFSN